MRRGAGISLAALLALAASACGGSGGGTAGGARTTAATTSSTVAGGPLAAALTALCLARGRVEADPGSARATFYDRAHASLHTIARQLEPLDRGLAARLLEAKETVEADFRTEPLTPTLAADLDHLIDSARQGLARLSISAGACR